VVRGVCRGLPSPPPPPPPWGSLRRQPAGRSDVAIPPADPAAARPPTEHGVNSLPVAARAAGSGSRPARSLTRKSIFGLESVPREINYVDGCYRNCSQMPAASTRPSSQQLAPCRSSSPEVSPSPCQPPAPAKARSRAVDAAGETHRQAAVQAAGQVAQRALDRPLAVPGWGG